MLYRDAHYGMDEDDTGIAEVIIAKDRGGYTGTVELKYIPEHTTFKDL